jgi:hypothetical protein
VAAKHSSLFRNMLNLKRKEPKNWGGWMRRKSPAIHLDPRRRIGRGKCARARGLPQLGEIRPPGLGERQGLAGVSTTLDPSLAVVAAPTPSDGMVASDEGVFASGDVGHCGPWVAST